MSLTDSLFRKKFINRRVPNHLVAKYNEALKQWDEQNPMMAGTYNESMMEGLLTFVSKEAVKPLPEHSKSVSSNPHNPIIR